MRLNKLVIGIMTFSFFMKPTPMLQVLQVIVLSLALPIVHAAPITFNTALPLGKGQGLVRSLVSYNQQRGSIDEASVRRDSLSLNSVLAYGINARWAAFAVVPVSHIDFSSNTQRSSDSAIGDAIIFSRYEVWRMDGSGTTRRLAPFVGVRLPSGDTGLTSDGTTDAFAGLVYTSARTKQNFDLQLKFDLNGNHQGLDVGNSFSLDASWQRRIAPSTISVSTKGFWFAALETNVQYSQRSRLFGQADPNSGGLIASLAPGVQYVTRRWIAELAVRIPVISNLNGEALESDFTVFTGIRANF